MRLYLDENVPILLAPLLVPHGFDCLTTRDGHNLSRSDEEQLVFAFKDRRILCTFNCQDFHQLAVQWQTQDRSHAGIIPSKELSLPELLRRFRYLIAHHQDRDLVNQTLWLTAPPRQ